MGPSKSSPPMNASSLPIIPDDLIREILSLLEVKILMKFKCVCKSWNSLISSDPSFIKTHLNKSSQNPVMFSSYQLKDCRRVIGSCNGLICFLGSLRRNRDFYLCLWNPATRSFSQKLPFFPNKYHPADFDIIFSFGFGYHNLTNKYKVVAIFPPNEVRVFTFGDNVWTNIQTFPTPAPPSSMGVFFSNSLNWFSLRDCDFPLYSSNNLTLDQFLIISLDLGTETYTQYQFPRDFDQVPDRAPIVCVLTGYLCLSMYSKQNGFIIWQMRGFGVQNSWNKLIQVNHCDNIFWLQPKLFPLHIFENGDTIILSTIYGSLIHYNIRDNTVVRGPKIDNHLYRFFVYNYVESLVSTRSNTSKTDGTKWNGLKKALLKKVWKTDSHSSIYLLPVMGSIAALVLAVLFSWFFQS